jgi:hypothetical protein
MVIVMENLVKLGSSTEPLEIPFALSKLSTLIFTNSWYMISSLDFSVDGVYVKLVLGSE